MSISREVLAKYIVKNCLFIESGSRWGDSSIRAIELGAGEVWTYESDQLFATLAEMHIADVLRDKAKQVKVNHGDSAKWFSYWNGYSPNRAIVVFLDAHTATHSPVLQELEAMKAWEMRPVTILIDDLSCMAGWGIQFVRIMDALGKLGYVNFKKEHGVKPEDILVASK